MNVSALDQHTSGKLVLETHTSDWDDMKHQLLDNLYTLIIEHGDSPTGFNIEDRVGIYSSLPRISCTGAFTSDARVFLLQFSVFPTSVCPGKLVLGECNTPYSYSDVCQEFANAVLKVMRDTQPKHHSWIFKTIQAEPVTVGKYYGMRLLFVRREHDYC